MAVATDVDMNDIIGVWFAQVVHDTCEWRASGFGHAVVYDHLPILVGGDLCSLGIDGCCVLGRGEKKRKTEEKQRGQKQQD